MKYRDSIERSAECLRLAVPLMAKQAAALHPVSYAIWYEYVAGGNDPLRRDIDRLVNGGTPLDEEATYALYRKHIAELDETTARDVSEGFERVLADITHSAAQAGDQATRFGSALEQWSGGLDAIPAAAAGILRDTRQMQASINTLNGRLDESRREIERLQQEVSRARQDALSDGLTGLVNRRGFDLSLAACLATPEPPFVGPSLLIADIDHFKKINDSYGHLFGDKVIRSIAQILKANVKGKDVAARYGGEEFVVLLPETPLAGAHAVAEKIRATIAGSRIRRTDNNELLEPVTISVGVTSYRAGESSGDFVGRADGALYASKTQGRNRVTVAELN
jgi:diguanylate cyclase